MSVGNPEQFNFKILTTGREDVDNRKPCNLSPLTLEKLLKWIDKQTVDENTKRELKKSASNYPHQALGSWQKNFSKHVATAQAKLKKIVKTTPKPKLPELGDELLEHIDEREICKDNCKDNNKEAEEYKSTEFNDDFESNLIDESENSGGH